jgi:outer membrane protein OmpA-like peptidoglycan-associated protein
MRLRFALPLAVAAVAASGALPARADPAGWYVGGAGGWADLASVGSSSSSLNFTSNETDGFRVLGFAGYDFGGIFRAEGELGYHHHDVQSLTVINDGGLGARLGRPSLTGASAAPTGTISALSFMLNGIVDLAPTWRVSPYVGGGFGAAQLSLNKLGVAGVTLADDSDVRIAGQGIAGIGAQLSPRVSLGAEYRYFLTANPSFNDTSGTPFHTKYREQSVLLKITYHFGAAAPHRAAPSPAMPQIAEASPPPHTPPLFLVFFDFDKATLTPAGAQVVEQAAAAYRSAGAARVDVTGYTDLVGSVAYNLKLSKRRADTVRAYLMNLGVPASAIIERARGKQDPRVPTADGVRERENRRVEIIIQ